MISCPNNPGVPAQFCTCIQCQKPARAYLPDPHGKVLGPAISRFGLVYSLRRPCRHHDVIQKMVEASVPGPFSERIGIHQGFMTTAGFMTRADTQRMLGATPEQLIGSVLTSEDLW
jgi:hypothetical protein